MKKTLTAFFALLISASTANADTGFAPFPLVKDATKLGIIGAEFASKLEGGFYIDTDGMIDGYDENTVLNPLSPPLVEWPPVESPTQFSMCEVMLLPPGYECINTPNGPKIVLVLYSPPTPIIQNWWDSLGAKGDYTQTWRY